MSLPNVKIIAQKKQSMEKSFFWELIFIQTEKKNSGQKVKNQNLEKKLKKNKTREKTCCGKPSVNMNKSLT